MNYRKYTTLVLSAACSLTALVQAQVTWLPKISTPPVIDGEIDQIWKASNAHAIANVERGAVEGTLDLSANWYGVYDDQNLYAIFIVTDQFLEAEAGADPWRNDRIEVYFNMDNSPNTIQAWLGDNSQYAFPWNKPSLAGASGGGTFTGVEWVSVNTSFGYITEVKFPWTSLIAAWTSQGGSHPTPAVQPPTGGFNFGFDIAINDNDGNSVYDSVTTWWKDNPAGLWNNISLAGTLGLGPDFDGNYSPEIQPLPPTHYAPGISASFNIDVIDANPSDTIVITAEDLPSFATFTDNGNRTATVQISTSSTVGIYSFTVRASDGTYQNEQPFVFTIQDPDAESPVFIQADPITIAQGLFRRIPIQVTDSDSTQVSISGVELPSFVRIVDNGDKTATLEINPSFSDLGSFTLTLKAVDENLGEGTTDIALTVSSGTQRHVFYCDPVNGNIENDGSQESPWSTLQEVFETRRPFVAGDTICLLDGYHGKPSVQGANEDYVYIKAAPGASPKAASLIIGGNNWDVSGMTISSSFAPVHITEVMVSISGQNNRFHRSTVYSHPDISSWTASDWRELASNGVGSTGENTIIERVTILNTRFAVSVSGPFNVVRNCHVQNFSGDGIRTLGDDQVIEYNYISDGYNVGDGNHDDGIQSWSPGSGSGTIYRVTLRGNTVIQSTDTTRPMQTNLQGIACFDGMYDGWLIENNVVIVNHFHGITLMGAINSRFLNNTVIDFDPNSGPNGTWIEISNHKNYDSALPENRPQYAATGNVARNNLASGYKLPASTGTHDHNMAVPYAQLTNYFVGYPYDFRLLPESPAIDAGSGDNVPEEDINGNPRPQNEAFDNGAFEFSEWQTTPIGHMHYPAIPQTGFSHWAYNMQYGWIYTTQGTGAEYGNYWLWHPADGWLWTSETIYPVLYSYTLNEWITGE